MGSHSKKITFPGSQGAPLAARLDYPEGKTRAFALFAHCFTCSKDLFAAARIARELTERGFAVFRFDFTGLGMSEGEFANTTFSSNVQDLLAAAKYLRETLMPVDILIGHSLGGAAVLAAAGDIPEAKAVATIGAPADAAHQVGSADLDDPLSTGADRLAGLDVHDAHLDPVERQPAAAAMGWLEVGVEAEPGVGPERLGHPEQVGPRARLGSQGRRQCQIG